MLATPRLRRCIVGLFGLERSLRWTAPSIGKNIIAPLREAGFNVQVAAHFNRPAIIDNPRSGERSTPYRPAGTFGLPIEILWAEPQIDAMLSIATSDMTAQPYRDYADETGATRRNLGYQLHSLRRLGSLIDLLDPASLDLVVLIRPDLEYLDRLLPGRDLQPILAGALDIVTPGWHQWGGLNDRFCIATPAAAKAVIERGTMVRAFGAAKGYIHSEELLQFAVQHFGLRQGETPLRARRVRADGTTLGEDFQPQRFQRWRERGRRLRQKLPF